MPDETNRWRFDGIYPNHYVMPDLISRFIHPGDVHEWPDGPPDGNWAPEHDTEPEDEPEPHDQAPGEDEPAPPEQHPAPSVSDTEKE